MKGAAGLVTVFARIALAAGFFSAVADRFALWGEPGAPGVAWGSFDRFLAYAATLNPWLPEPWVPYLGWLVTALEVGLGSALLVGLWTRRAALASGGLLLLFALGMTVGTGVKSALDASVFAASAAGLLLATADRFPLSLDELRADGSARLGLGRARVSTSVSPGGS